MNPFVTPPFEGLSNDEMNELITLGMIVKVGSYQISDSILKQPQLSGYMHWT